MSQTRLRRLKKRNAPLIVDFRAAYNQCSMPYGATACRTWERSMMLGTARDSVAIAADSLICLRFLGGVIRAFQEGGRMMEESGDRVSQSGRQRSRVSTRNGKTLQGAEFVRTRTSVRCAAAR